MNAPTRLSVVIATEHSFENLAAILDALRPQSHPQVAVVIVTADLASHAAAAVLGSDNVTVLEARPGSLIPEMWRDGIVSCSSTWVALLTAHCVPDARWLDRIIALEFDSRDVAVGGFFSNPATADAASWAIYFLRYGDFATPHDAHNVSHVAADNAVYRRAAVLACEDLLPRGFWEPEYHRRFVSAGQRLRLDSQLMVIHRNRYNVTEFAAQRRAHGFQYGLDRALKLSAINRILYFLALPLVPMVLFAKVCGRAARSGQMSRAPITTPFRLLQFILHWARGEARGVTHALRQS